MKKIFILAIMAAFIGFASSCTKEGALEPTNIENDWSTKIDMSNSYIKDLYEKTGVAIFTDFDDNRDVLYQGSDYGLLTGVQLTHIDASEQTKAVEWLKTNILDCFSSECIKKYFPKRIFICKNIYVASPPGYLGPWLHEMKYVNNFWTVSGSQHALPFTQGFGVSVNVEELYNTASSIDYKTQYRTDIMMLLCFELFMNNDFLEDIKNNPDIFPDDVVKLYDMSVLETETTNSIDSQKYATAKGMYRTVYGVSAKDRTKGDIITRDDNSKMSLKGYFSFGFPETTQNSANAYSGGYVVWPTGKPTSWQSSSYIGYDGTKITVTADGYISSISSTYNFKSPNGQYRDSRNLIFALIDLNSVKLTVYGDLLISRLYYMSEYLKEKGIDFQKYNPAVTEMYRMHSK